MEEYEFKAKPGDPQRRPAFVAPYQPRIDWQIWFAAMSRPEEYPWTLHFVWKLLHNDPQTLSLLASNPFPAKPPRYIRARFYRYEFAQPGDPTHAWWKRTPAGSWLPPLSIDEPQLRRSWPLTDGCRPTRKNSKHQPPSPVNLQTPSRRPSC